MKLDDFILLCLLGRYRAGQSGQHGKTPKGIRWANIFDILLNIPRGIPHLGHDGALLTFYNEGKAFTGLKVSTTQIVNKERKL